MRRALLIGSQTGGLTGVHGDIEVMDDALTKLGFTTMPTVGADATTDEIVARYRGLIQDSRPDDAVLVYYSGHGGRQPNPLAGAGSTSPTWLQYIVPTDFDDRSGGRARCVLAEELSALQAELTGRTRNVTVVLDCCHAARMSRGSSALPKANGRLVLPADDLARRWRQVVGRLPGADANADAVRVVACGPDQSAYEDYDTGLGGRHGMLTAALVGLLTGPDATLLTWSDVLEVLRRAFGETVALQRPEIEGPAGRLLFSLDTRGGTGVLPVRVVSGRAVLPNAAVFGLSPGDRYDLTVPGSARPVCTAEVDHLDGADGVLRLDGVDPATLPAGTFAWPVRVALARRTVAVPPAAGPWRERIVAELARDARVDAVAEQANAVAAVVLADDHVQVLDSARQPLYPQPVAVDDKSIGRLVKDVRTLGIAEQVRSLPSGTGTAALASDVDIQYARVLADGSEVALVSGDHLFAGDRIRLSARNTAAVSRYLSVFDIGLAGAVTMLTTSEPSGITLLPDARYVLGDLWSGGALPLQWPTGLPRGEPRVETLVTMVADRRVDGLRSLGQPGVRAVDASANTLEQLLAGLTSGRRDLAPPGQAGVRWRVERFDFLLHPDARPETDEPSFEIDERPPTSLRYLVPLRNLVHRGAPVPARVAVRLTELTVHSNRSFLRSRVRIDTMVITAAPAESGGPYRANTMRFDRIKDGDKLPFDHVLIYEGPVDRFLDIAVWVAKDDTPDTNLAELFAKETGSKEVAAALTTLIALAVAAPAAAVAASSVAAVAVLVRTAARLVDAARGSSIGVYRTTLLAYESFGATARHPAQGLLRAQDMSFAFEVIDLT